MRRFLCLISLFSLLLTSCSKNDRENISRLSLIQKRNQLICGVSGKIPGFSFLNSDGKYEGFDVDICKAFAAAIIGNTKNIQYRPLTRSRKILSD